MKKKKKNGEKNVEEREGDANVSALGVQNLKKKKNEEEANT